MKKLKLLISVFLISTTVLQAQTPATIPDKPEVIFVTGGTFKMGSNGYDDEKPIHDVTLSSYSIGKYPVTVGQYKAFCEATGRAMPEPPEWGWMDRHPMVKVNFNDAVRYCNWLGERYGGEWRLPSEAEWEYAARGGNKSMGYTYSGGNNLEQVGWFENNAGGETNAVGRKKPNELGIYDMSGNVWEWCSDWYDEDYYTYSRASNPRGPSSGSYRVMRGGSWGDSAPGCRVAARYDGDPSNRYINNGFRVVLFR